MAQSRGYFSGYPVHDFGSGSALEGLRRFQGTRRAKEQAMVQAISQLSMSGNMPNFEPGNAGYEKIKETLGADVAQGMRKVGKTAVQQKETKKRYDAFDQGLKLWGGIEALEKNLGPKARSTDMYKKFLDQTAKSFSTAFGASVNLNPMLDIKDNQEKLRSAGANAVNKIMTSMTGDSSPADFNNVELAINEYTKLPGADKKLIDGWKTQLDADRKAAVDRVKTTQAKNVKPYTAPDGSVKYIPSNQTPPQGYVPYTAPTDKQRDLNMRKAIVPRLQNMHPEDAYREGWKMNDNGSVAVGYDGAATKLPEFTDALGKRGGPTALKAAGELWDDAKELKALFDDPAVAANLGKAKNAGLWDRIKGAWSNRVSAWMSKNGIAEDSPTATAIRRIQRMASEERKEFLGAAVTETELKSVLGWMPAPGDAYDAMVSKVDLINKEAGQEFKRVLDIYKDVANMAPWYDAFGISRFGAPSKKKTKAQKALQSSPAMKKMYEKYPWLKSE